MYDFHGKGHFPAPHSPSLSTPEFLQELYAKISECVTKVNECITLVDTSNNVVENWNNVKAECDMVMEQYANVMAGYASTMGGYTQELESLEGRVDNLNASISHLETLIEVYRTEVDQKAQEVLDELAVLTDSIVEVGTANGWYYRKYKSGRFDATKQLDTMISGGGYITYDGNIYTVTIDVVTPFNVATSSMLWLQPMLPGYTPCVLKCNETYFKTSFQYRGDISGVSIFPVYCRMEGTVA